MLATGGTVVSFGQTTGASATFAADVFYATGGATLYGFYLFYEAERDPVAGDLAELARLVAGGELLTNIDATLPFAAFTDAISARSKHGLRGKVVVTLP
jgi:NADPH:quinone reductase-like Zn-dependent oxidoreductase